MQPATGCKSGIIPLSALNLVSTRVYGACAARILQPGQISYLGSTPLFLVVRLFLLL